MGAVIEMKIFYFLFISLILISLIFVSSCSNIPDSPASTTTTLVGADKTTSTTLPIHDGGGNSSGLGDSFGEDPNIKPPAIP